MSPRVNYARINKQGDNKAMTVRTNKGGRPKGSQTSPPSVPNTIAHQVLRDVRQRAKDGSAEDQRAVLNYYALSLASQPPSAG